MCGSRPTLQYKHNDMDIAMPMEEIGRWSRREAGLLSSQKQEIQVCERTRPNKKYPGLGPCSESWLAEAQGLRGSARQGKGAQCGCPKGTAVAGANQLGWQPVPTRSFFGAKNAILLL